MGSLRVGVPGVRGVVLRVSIWDLFAGVCLCGRLLMVYWMFCCLITEVWISVLWIRVSLMIMYLTYFGRLNTLVCFACYATGVRV